MQNAPLVFVASVFALTACGSSDGTPASKGPSSKPVASDKGTTEVTAASGFNPPAAPEGYTRIVAQTVKDVPPGGDVTYCQYIMAPFDRDVDVLGVSGYQSKWGHHAVAFTYQPADGEETGSSFPCMGTEFSANSDPMSSGHALSMGAFLGGVGGEGGGTPSSTLPDGVATRLKAGQGVMLNVHYLNSGDQVIDGNAVVDLKFADATPDRVLASMFVNLNFNFEVAPSTKTTSSIDCVAKSDLQIIMMSNHMHEFGTSASTQVIRAGDGSMEDLHDDNTWNFDMQFNPNYSHWDVADPFVLHTGDTIRTTCNWQNTTADDMKFPREMCLGVGFVLATGDNPTAPMCANGLWVPQGI